MVSRVKKSVASSGDLSTQEGPPAGVCSAWCGAKMGGGEDPADGMGPQPVPQSSQLALDTPVAPGRVLLREAQHQITDLVADARTAGPVRVSPTCIALRGVQATGAATITPTCLGLLRTNADLTVNFSPWLACPADHRRRPPCEPKDQGHGDLD
jgi:hypothetical protein